LLQAKELAFSEAKNELLFERKRPRSNPKSRPKISEKAVTGGRKAVLQQDLWVASGSGRAPKSILQN
jgi:hypothetical protein